MSENHDYKILVEAEIKLNDCKTKAFLRLQANDEGKPLDIDLINELIKRVGITYGINNNAIEDIVMHPQLERDFLIAEGKEQINGTDGKIHYYAEDNSAMPKLLPDGKVDYHDLGIINNVKKGDILAKIVPPKKGINGIDVFGRTIKARDGKAVLSPIGKNVVLNNDEIVSKIDGQLVWIYGKINVFQVFEVKGDVDYSIGNIDFVGSVHIRGNVNTGFKIKAKGDIIIDGILDSSEILCEGNVIVRNGIKGGGKGLLRCKGNLTTKYIENCKIEAEGSVYCEAILYSKISCNRGIYVNGRHSMITNSVVRTKNEIVANNIGSPMYAPTEIEVGFDPKIKKQITDVKYTIEELNEKLLKINKIINYFRQTLTGNIDEEHKSLYEKTLLTQKTIEEQLDESTDSLKRLSSEMDISENAKIKVNDTLYQGVKVTIGYSTIFINQDYHRVILKESDNSQIVFFPI